MANRGDLGGCRSCSYCCGIVMGGYSKSASGEEEVLALSLGWSYIFTGIGPVGDLIASMMFIKAGWGFTSAALLQLDNVGVDDDIRTFVHKAATKVFG